MKIWHFKSLAYISTFSILLSLNSCKNDSKSSSNSPNSESTINEINTYLTDFFSTEKDKSGITGIPLTFQCKNYFASNAKTFNIGTQSKNGDELTNESLFQIGSNSKVFLSVVMLQLEQEGLVSIEDPISKYLSDKYPLWKNIKIKNLLNMTSGIPNYTGEKDVIGEILIHFKNDPKKNVTSEEILFSVKDKPLLVQTTNKFSYSNTNYVLAGEIIKAITGKDISEEISDRIIKPLGLKNTFYITTYPKSNVKYPKHLMSGYYYITDDKFRIFDNWTDIIDFSMSWGNAAGSITANSIDLNNFIRSLFAGKLLNPDQLKKLTTMVDTNTGEELSEGVNEKSNSGYGLGIAAIYNSTLKEIEYRHGGGTFGFRSQMRYFPSIKASYVIAFNSSEVGKENEMTLYKNIDNYILKNCK
ncbi:serine hydrolase domain-containing protein [Pigmentibacter ruber]|uniref:serine hydrolase domain-containing protein n=1 Tax=Pigmentibacter ruber TaxID=2683196 RepID=UPI00131A8640|nr:serine hydrolase domain-containing protein [Pigmentibacter ruber]